MAKIEGLITITSTVDLVVDHKNTVQASRIPSIQSQASPSSRIEAAGADKLFCFAYASKHVRKAHRNRCFHWDLTQAQTFNIRWLWIVILENYPIPHLILRWQPIQKGSPVKEPARAPGSLGGHYPQDVST